MLLGLRLVLLKKEAKRLKIQNLSQQKKRELQKEMVGLIKKVSDTVKDTRPEDIYCFNLDFFKI